jgi:hypothetical protein
VKLYSDFPARRLRQILADVIALCLIAGAIWIGVYVHSLVMELAAFGVQVETAGEGFSQTMEDVGDRFAGIPLLGNGVASLFDDASGAGGGLADAGRTGQAAISNLALGLGWAIGGLPSVMVLMLWLPTRIRFARRAAAVTRLLAQEGSLDLLALRALTTHKIESLNALAPGAASGWRRGDPETIHLLAGLELRSSGVQVRSSVARKKSLGRV